MERSTTSAQSRRMRVCGCADRLTVVALVVARLVVVPGWVRAECADGACRGRWGARGDGRQGNRHAFWTAIWNAAAPECIHDSVCISVL